MNINDLYLDERFKLDCEKKINYVSLMNDTLLVTIPEENKYIQVIHENGSTKTYKILGDITKTNESTGNV